MNTTAYTMHYTSRFMYRLMHLFLAFAVLCTMGMMRGATGLGSIKAHERVFRPQDDMCDVLSDGMKHTSVLKASRQDMCAANNPSPLAFERQSMSEIFGFHGDMGSCAESKRSSAVFAEMRNVLVQ